MIRYESRYNSLRRLVDNRLRKLVKQKNPEQLNNACRYVLSAGGKRVRSTLVLLSCEAVGGRPRQAIDACAAIELMHNFTLVHDDIMDKALSRRGRATVHTKWDLNTALLTGDVLLGLAYRQILRNNSKDVSNVLSIFTEGFLDVCEGQALDLEFEHRSDVSLRDYFSMIEKKTGRLIGTATEIGAVIGGGTEKQINALRAFGHHIGRAFQLQDDLLDVVADQKELGKIIGGDIIEGKKTFLLLKSLETARGKDRAALLNVMNRRSTKKIRTVERRKREVQTITAIYRQTGALDAARSRIMNDTKRANAALASLPATDARAMLLWFSGLLLKRNF